MSHTTPTYPLKFIKGLRSSFVDELTATQGARFFMKLLYEFWGFCVNGTNDLRTPGGLASVSGANFPSGFTTGSSVIASGSDGVTSFGTDVFQTITGDFINLHSQLTGSSETGLVGKYLVTWKPGSTSTDDSVYRIKTLTDVSSIRVEVITGGTTRLGAKAFFQDRSEILWRVVDIGDAAALSGWTSGMGLTLQFEQAPTVNAGQATPQVHVALETESSLSRLRLTVSPSGSWNGTTFTDYSGSLIVPWTVTTSGESLFYLIGGKECLIAQSTGVDDAWNANPVGFHVEVPKRLLTAQHDPNPVALMVWHSGSAATQLTAYNNFSMVGPGSRFERWNTLVRAPFGDITNTTITPNSGGLWHDLNAGDRFGRVHFNPYANTYLSTDAVLYNVASGSFCFGRCRLRRIRFTANNLKVGQRLGEEWIHAGNGILWPWDNSDQPFGILHEGGP